MQELQDNMKVFVGMSGGVDSSLTAALLIERGHNVTGVRSSWYEMSLG